MDNDWKLLGKRLQARIDEGLTKAELCKKAGVSPSQLDGYLPDPKEKRTLRAPGLDTAERLASAVGQPLWELLKPIDTSVSESKREMIATILGMNEPEAVVLRNLLRKIVGRIPHVLELIRTIQTGDQDKDVESG